MHRYIHVGADVGLWFFKDLFISKLLLSDQTFCLIVANNLKRTPLSINKSTTLVELGDARPAVASLIGVGQKMVKL